MAHRSFPELFAAAVKRRQSLLERFAAVRLVDGSGDQIPDLYVDRFGPIALVHLHADDDSDLYRSQLKTLPDWSMLGVETVYFRQRFKKSSRSAEHPAEIVFGGKVKRCPIEEHGVNYLIDPERHLNAGFFIDTRDVRSRLKTVSAGKRVLNLFSYTGSLGLSALAGGAVEVVQVDINKGVLSWAKENAALNRELSGTMRVIPEDSLVFMERESKRILKEAPRYDTVIVDPPSFSRSSQGIFQIERDLDLLVHSALRLLVPVGELILMTNCSSLNAETVAERVHSIVNQQSARVLMLDFITPPEDFPSIIEDSIATRGVIVKIAATS